MVEQRITKSMFRRIAIQMGYEKIEYGHWIERYHWDFKYECSVCHCGCDVQKRFCGDCGAKMNEVSE